MKTVILKLGGGVLTYKYRSRPAVRTTLIKRIAKELAYVCKKRPSLKLILLYGVGSFGHPLVYKHHLINRALTASSLNRVGEVINSTRELGTQFARICLKAGVPVIPLQTSSLLRRKNGKTFFNNLSVIEAIIKYGGIPLLGGDMVIGENNFSYVASADELAVLLSKHFKNSEIFFATSVEGVYKCFPPKKGEQPLKIINRRGLESLTNKRFLAKTEKKHDVTGEMAGKLRKLLYLRNRKVVIFNGQKLSLLRKTLMSKKVLGTTILL